MQRTGSWRCIGSYLFPLGIWTFIRIPLSFGLKDLGRGIRINEFFQDLYFFPPDHA